MAPPPETFTSRSFQFACHMVTLYRALLRIPGVPGHIARQLLRSGTSIGANLEEAKAAQSRRDLIARFSIAVKEARETKYWLRLLKATQSAPDALIEPPLAEVDQLVAILTVSVRRLRSG